MLHEALTGTLPIDGAPLQILLRKQREDPAPPSRKCGAVPADLDQLCVHLLRRDPAARPRGDEILGRLGEAPRARTGPSATRSSSGHEGGFVGRTAELGVLDEALERMRKGECVKVLAHGESGIGKTRLVQHFLEIAQRGAPDVLVLAGRCYERESVPYKAFDGVIDAISRELLRWPEVDVARVLPRQAGLLARVFPVLGRVRSFAREAPPTARLDPQEQRSRLLTALRELFVRIADGRPLVVLVDDLQWADHDSLTLLAELVREPDPPRLLLLATSRIGATELFADGVLRPRGLDELRIDRLTVEDAEALASSLLGDVARAADVGREAAGHPLFIEELSRHAGPAGEGEAGAPLRLDDALRGRVGALPAEARAVLEHLALAGVRVAAGVLQQAAGIDAAPFDRAVAELRVVRLVKTSGRGDAATVEPYHDRIRESVTATIAAGAREAMHRALAGAFERSPDADPERLLDHWRGAGEPAKAAGHALVAAARAEGLLAFYRAAHLYRDARELGAPDARAVARKEARSLALAGRGALAAEVYRGSWRGRGSTRPWVCSGTQGSSSCAAGNSIGASRSCVRC